MKVHPAAECFRLMHDDELAALAEDIKLNGLRDPLTAGRIKGAKAEFLVDGRNRQKACEIGGIEPRYEYVEFADEDEVKAFVKSRGERRDLTKGERAMALAILYPEPENAKGGRGKRSTSNLADSAGFSQTRLTQARMVLRLNKVLAYAVRDGIEKLDAALTKVTKDQQELQSTEAKITRLRSSASDLADLVSDERMDVDEALAALEERGRKVQQIIDAGCHAANGSMRQFVASVSSMIDAAKLGNSVKLTKEQLKQVEEMISQENLGIVLNAARNLQTTFLRGSDG